MSGLHRAVRKTFPVCSILGCIKCVFLPAALINCQGLRASKETKIHQRRKIIRAFNGDNDMLLFSVDKRRHLFEFTEEERDSVK